MLSCAATCRGTDAVGVAPPRSSGTSEIACSGAHSAKRRRDCRQRPDQHADHGSAGRPDHRAATGPTVVALTLDDAVKLALERNLDIAVQRLNPEISDLAYRDGSGRLLPDLDVDAARRRGRRPRPPTRSRGGSAAAAITNDATNWNGGLTQNLRWGGGYYTRHAEQHAGDVDITMSLLQSVVHAAVDGAVHAAAASRHSVSTQPASSSRSRSSTATSPMSS